jgi:hypothetical protein
MPLVDAHPMPMMRMEDVLGKDGIDLPARVAKSLGEIKTLPMPYDLLPPEMRAKKAHERRKLACTSNPVVACDLRLCSERFLAFADERRKTMGHNSVRFSGRFQGNSR